MRGFAIWLLVLLCFMPPVFADTDSATLISAEEKEWLDKNAAKISLWFNDSFPPIEFANENGDFIGLGADIIKQIEQKLAVTFNKKVCPDWQKHLSSLESGECAIAPTVVKVPKREKYAFFTSVYAKIPVVIITTHNLNLGATLSGLSLKDLKGKKIAVVKEYATEAYLKKQKELDNEVEIVAFSGVKECLQAVAFGKVAAYVESLAVASHYISELGINNLWVSGVTDYSFDFRIAVSKKYPLLFSSIQKAIKSLKSSELKNIKSRWIKLQVTHELSPANRHILTVVMVALVLLITGLLIINAFLKQKLRTKIIHLTQVQKKAIDEEARFRLFFLHAPIPLVELNLDGTNILLNNSFKEKFGYTEKELHSVDDWWLLAYPDPNYRESVKKKWIESIRSLKRNSSKQSLAAYDIACKTGAVRKFTVRQSLIGARVLIAFVDVSDLAQTKNELSKSLSRFNDLFDLLPFSCVINDMKGCFLLANKCFCTKNNISHEELIGKTNIGIGRFIDPELKKEIEAQLKENGSVENIEISVNLASGKKSAIILSSQIIDWKGQKAILSATVDITKRKQAEAALKAKEENLRVTLNSIGDAVISTNINGEIANINPIAQKLTGWKDNEAIGKPLKEIFNIFNAKSREKLETPVEKVLRTGQIIGLANHTILKSRNGTEYQIADSGAPIRNDNGDILGIVLVFRDVTEEYALQEKLRQSQKMDAIGHLASGVAHDFNNMLSGIIGGAELLLLEQKKQISFSAKSHIKMILEASERAKNLVSQLLTFARKQPQDIDYVKIEKPLLAAVELFGRTADKRIKVETDLKVKGNYVLGDFSQLQNAFLNIMINASHAMPKGGTIYVSINDKKLDNDFCSLSAFNVKPGDYVEVEIKDTGCGMSEEVKSRIFEPFFTTKESGKGTGLGLATVFGIIQQSSGAIEVETEVGKGTSFHLFFPATEEFGKTGNDIAHESFITGTGRILIVDDEPIVLTMTDYLLKGLGYETVLAENGKQAVEIFSKEYRDIDLIILDMAMPEMDGEECLNRLIEINSGVKVIVSTGYAFEEKYLSLKNLGVEYFINKPYKSAEMSKIINEVIVNSNSKK